MAGDTETRQHVGEMLRVEKQGSEGAQRQDRVTFVVIGKRKEAVWVGNQGSGYRKEARFSISSNRSSNKPHWLRYRHCAKLERKRGTGKM